MIDRRRFLLSSALAIAPLAAIAQGTASPVDLDDLDAVLAETGTPALGGVVVTDRGVAWLKVAGQRRLGAPDPVTLADRWHLGSNTKAMTAALYARLVQGGTARWGATLRELFPDIPVHETFRDVTIEQLLSHRSGILDASVLHIGWLMTAHADPTPAADQRRALAARVLQTQPAGAVGAFAYGNLNYVLAGAAIERLTGRPWEEAITANLFRPLGLVSAGFGAPPCAQPWGHRGAVPINPAGIADNPLALGPAGRAHMALDDYAKVLGLFIGNAPNVLTPASVLKLTVPETAGSTYALGWGVVPTQRWTGGPALSHDGSNTLWYCTSLVAPARRLALAVVANDAVGGRIAVRRLATALISRFATPAPAPAS